MKIDRRRALALLGFGAAAGSAAAQSPAGPAGFAHGVASGDPLADRVVIWTRLTPARPGEVAEVRWEVAEDPGFARIAARGRAQAAPERDHTVKIDVAGLKPGTDYFYRFAAGDRVSPVGRARTLPVGPTPDVVLAVASCSLYPHGYFNAYQAIADLPRVDAVLHLGDYIYEYGGAASYGMDSPVAHLRPHDPPHEILTLADYRRRHAQYKADPQLQAAHARAPWIVVWDDHETTNDSWTAGAQNHQPDEGDWTERKAIALRAYYEWMPIREPAPGRPQEAIYRSFDFGDLARLIMVETRIGARDAQLDYEKDLPVVDGRPDLAAFRAKLHDPSRRLMSPEQEAWLAGELAASAGQGQAWQVLGNQVVMARVNAPNPRAVLGEAELAQLLAQQPPEIAVRIGRLEQLARLGLPYGLDMWDGYPVARERLYTAIRNAGARPIVVSGDSHAFWANELHDASGQRVAVEFGTTGITSPGGGDIVKGFPIAELFAAPNPEVRFNGQTSKGFVRLTLTRDEARVDLMEVSSIHDRAFETRVLKSFRATPDGAGVSALAEA